MDQEKADSSLMKQQHEVLLEDHKAVSEIRRSQQLKLLQSKSRLTVEEMKLVKKFSEKLPFVGKWKDFIGLPSTPFHIVIFGKPGQGKGFFSCEFSKYLSNNFGKVLYISPEEYGQTPFADKLIFYDMTSDPMRFITSGSSCLDDICKDLEEENPKFVIIDSITEANLTDNQLKILKSKFPKISTISIAQTDKLGNIRGSQKLTHNTDVVLEVKQGFVYSLKNRLEGYHAEAFKISFPKITARAKWFSGTGIRKIMINALSC